ncbi:hypothetical protein RYX36_035208, partial [Vicia faba]
VDSRLKRKGVGIGRKQTKKAAKDPNKPNRPPSAFFVFMDDFREQYKRDHPNNKSVAAVGKACAKSDSKAADSRLKRKGAGIGRKQTKKAAKDPNKPKRPPSAFFVFMADFREQYKRDHPNNKFVAAVGKACAADHLLDTKSESKESMFTGLSILRNTSLETTSSGINDKNGTIRLGSTKNHVLNEIPMSRGINDSTVILSRLKLPQSNINCDTSFMLSLELVKNLNSLTHMTHIAKVFELRNKKRRKIQKHHDLPNNVSELREPFLVLLSAWSIDHG